MVYMDGVIFGIQRFGGISVYFNEIMTCYKNKNIEFSLYLEGSGIGCVSSALSENVTFTKRMFPFSRLLDVPVPEQFSIFHSTYYRLPKSRGNVKIVTTVHDFTTEIYGKGIRRIIHKWQKRRAVLNSDVIVCISENTKKDLFKYIPECSSKRVEVIYNGVSDDYYQINVESSISLHVLNGYVLFVGHRSGYKNFFKVVEALAKLECLKLVIVGGGDLSVNEVELLNYNIGTRYSHLGYVDNKELNRLYNNAVCLVYPSEYEGFGIPVVEAMKCGCPVIMAKNSSLAEIASDSSLFFEDTSGLTIADLILKLRDFDFRSSEVKKGILNASKFSWEHTANKYLEIYKSLG